MRLAMKKGSGATYPVLWLSKAIVERLRITDRVVLLVNHHAIAVRAAEPNDPHARRIGKSRAFTVREFEHLLRPTESWGMEAEIDEGHAVAYLPDELVRRMRGAA